MVSKKYLQNFIFHGFIGIIALSGVQFSIDQYHGYIEKKEIKEITLAPASDFFEYRSTNPIKQEFEFGEPLDIVSDSAWHEKGDVTWNDILRCDFGTGNEYQFFSNTYTRADDFPSLRSLGLFEENTWVYTGKIPEVRPAKCFIDSTISFIEKKHDIVKTQQISSGEFIYK